MPNCDFYAAGEDLRCVVEMVLAEPGCRLFESYSEFDRPLREFGSWSELAAAYPIGTCRSRGDSVLLQVWPTMACADVTIDRQALNPRTCDGATWRERVVGWGMIQLYLGGVAPEGLVDSHTNHNSEQRALAFEPFHAVQMAPVAAWDWKEVVRTSSRWNRRLRGPLAVARHGSRPVLAQAAALHSTGLPFL
jgi:hypothetical protein